MADTDMESSLRKYREEKFEAKVSKSNDTTYSDQISLSVTHNGHQWFAIGLLPDEARTVIGLLETYLEESTNG